MILVTGAAGKTGQAIIRASFPNGEPVRALVHREEQKTSLLTLGADEVLVGDLASTDDIQRAFSGIRAVYHICPNMNPAEVDIGRNVIEAAKKARIEHFVYHSVLHPQVEAMQHHWHKMRVEALLFESGLPYTILQSAAYMQNVLGYWPKMVSDGEYAIPYSSQSQFTMIDLSDLAAVAAKVLREGKPHHLAIYECCGSQNLSSVEIASLVGDLMGREVKAVELDPVQWAAAARTNGLPSFAINTLVSMFEYYDKFGFCGNDNVLTWLLGRAPTRFEEFLSRSSHPNPSV